MQRHEGEPSAQGHDGATASAGTLAVVGCGYVGERLGIRAHGLGARVIATTRRPERAAALAARGLDARRLDPHDAAALVPVLAGCDALVHSVPPGTDGDATTSIATAAARAGVRALVYLGSTGVYPPDAGDVDERSALGATGRGMARLHAEQALREAAARDGLRVTILRIAAIYGPGRGIHVRLRAGAYRVAGPGTNYVSRIHVDDLVTTALRCAEAAGCAPPGTVTIYCVADDLPTTARAHADGVAAVLGLPPPPSMPWDEAPETLRSNRRVHGTLVRDELRFALAYPTWREGLSQCLAEEASGRRGLPP